MQMNLRVIVVVSAALVAVTACSQSAGPRATRESAAVPAAAAHAVHADQLRVIMARLNRYEAVAWPQEVEPRYTRPAEGRYDLSLQEAAELAGELAAAADGIPAAIDDVAMSDADRQEFLSRAAGLKTHADALRAKAVVRDTTGMRATLEMVRETCTACHTRFRDVSGPLR